MGAGCIQAGMGGGMMAKDAGEKPLRGWDER